MTVFDYLALVGESHAQRAREEVARQKVILEILEPIGARRAVEQARARLGRLEEAYRIALYRLETDRALSGRPNPERMAEPSAR